MFKKISFCFLLLSTVMCVQASQEFLGSSSKDFNNTNLQIHHNVFEIPKAETHTDVSSGLTDRRVIVDNVNRVNREENSLELNPISKGSIPQQISVNQNVG